ncbi:MAG: beta-lactamase family protein [Selenomonadaceae bacterium]|nr:beta-lactamase family protein [Selenomonadaceae bacterium]
MTDIIGDTGEKVPGLGVIAFKDGKEVYSKFIGYRNINKKLSVTRDTRFRVASISKMFTIFTIMQFVDKGTIDLDTDVSEYLGFNLRNPNFLETPITVRMLASHTSSLRDGNNYSLPPECSIEEFFISNGAGYEAGIHFAPRSETIGNYFKYSNLNYNLLGTIIEKVTGERFDLYQKKHILNQLDMKADYVVSNLVKDEFNNLGTIYKKSKNSVWNEDFDWIAQVDDYIEQPAKDSIQIRSTDDDNSTKYYDLNDYKVGTNATIFSPTGGLRISFEELSHCLQMLMNDGIYNGRQIISKGLLDEMMSLQWVYNGNNGDNYGVMFNYGLGMYKIEGGSDARLCKDYDIDFIGHSGEAYGLISGLYFIPNTMSGVLFMTNGTAVEPDINPKSRGKFSNSYIWEENIMNPICQYIFGKQD